MYKLGGNLNSVRQKQLFSYTLSPEEGNGFDFLNIPLGTDGAKKPSTNLYMCL